ncbi:hypothetical protein DFH27DRAFT_530136 [Peziza echinospora]|nr:hypothetical protein DFH27DRAFT_530136 [Peziza echinospora]
MALQHDKTKWAAIYQQYIRSTKKEKAGEAEERERMKGLILKAVGVREEAVEAARQEEREKITTAVEAAILQEREGQSTAWSTHLQIKGQRANDMIQLQVSRVQAVEEALRKSEAEVAIAKKKEKAEEEERKKQEKQTERRRKSYDCKMSAIVILADMVPTQESRDEDVEMGGVEKATKPWESPHNWRKAEARKEREKEQLAAPAQAVMAKAVVIHAIPTGWNVGWVANTVGGRLGSVIGVHWLLGEKRREGKTASSVVVYLNKEILVGNGARIRVGGG